MSTYSLPVALRDVVGGNAVKRLRNTGKIPSILYGHKQGNINLMVCRNEFQGAIKAKARMVSLKWDNNEETALVKEIQYDYLGDEIVHIDFARTDATETVNLQVPIELFGTPVGLKSHGVLDHALKEVSVECVVTSIPEKIRVSVAKIDVGQSILVKELDLPDGVKVTNNPDAIVAAVSVVAEEKEAAEGEDMAEPEVITAKKEDAPKE